MTTMAARLVEAMKQSAARNYGGEAVTELAHALQCADLAEAGGADEELALASLLHDVGRFAVAQDEISDTLEQVAVRAAVARGHHDAGADLIAPYVSGRVAFLVRSHTAAKRYLCAIDAGYVDSLSPASRRTLALQGGAMEPEEARRAEVHLCWADAVRLRRWDDAAKVVGKKTRPLSAWKPLLEKYFGAASAAR